MLQQILMKTPVWVWALLAFLVYRGLASSVDREAKLKKLFIIPVVMLGLSLQDIVIQFGTEAAAAPVWLAGMALGIALAWGRFSTDSVLPVPERGAVAMKGSWMPLVLMLSIFFTKYGVGLMLSLNPGLAKETMFVAITCSLYGLFNGAFIGQLLRIVAIYREGVARSHKLL